MTSSGSASQHAGQADVSHSLRCSTEFGVNAPEAIPVLA